MSPAGSRRARVPGVIPRGSPPCVVPRRCLRGRNTTTSNGFRNNCYTFTRARRTARPPRRRPIVDVKLSPFLPTHPPVAPPPRPNPDTIAGTHGRRTEMRSKSVTSSAASRLGTTRPPKHAQSRRERGQRSLLLGCPKGGGAPAEGMAPTSLRLQSRRRTWSATRRHQKSWRSEEGAGRGRGRGRSAERCGDRERCERMCCGRARAVGGACAPA